MCKKRDMVSEKKVRCEESISREEVERHGQEISEILVLAQSLIMNEVAAMRQK